MYNPISALQNSVFRTQHRQFVKNQKHPVQDRSANRAITTPKVAAPISLPSTTNEGTHE